MQEFSILQNEEFGRFAVASRALKAGETFCEEFPFAVGPKPGTTCVCLECFCPVDATHTGSRCENCSWPLCENCRKLSESETLFHKRECEVFRDTKCKFFNLKDPNSVCMQLDCIMPLRMILEKESDPQRWKSEVEIMECHRDKRFGSAAWNADNQNVVGYLLGPCKLKRLGIDGEFIQKVIGILEVNTFEGKTTKGHEVRILYPKIAMLSHSCTPNTTHSIHPSMGYRFIARASQDIEEGGLLLVTYTYTLSGTSDRQQHLQQGKFFQCRCPRCSDPTELDTNFSTLLCQLCHSGDVISSDPLSSQAVWRCTSNKCPFEDSAENVKRLLKALQDEIESANSVESMENLLEKFKSILHSNHFIMITIKNALVEMYGHTVGYLLSELPDALLRRKIELCEEVLELLDVFEGGKTRARGLMLFELHAPLALYAKTRHEWGGLTNEEYLEQLERAREVLRESMEIVSWEDEAICRIPGQARMSMEFLEKLIGCVKEGGEV